VLVGNPGKPWSDDEVALTVASYFEMWHRLILQEPVTKAAAVRELGLKIPARNRPAIEYKFRNISSVLRDRRDQWLDGYFPAPNIQGKLREAVDMYLLEHGELAAMIEAHTENILPGSTDPNASTEDVLVEPPSAHTRQRRVGIATGRVGALHDFQRRQLGKSGESWVMARERRSLTAAGRPDLAAAVRWSAKEIGDGLGYDIESFRPDGTQRLIEVKTTNNGILTPFYITRNEVDVSEARADVFSLYRVFDFRIEPKLYRLDGSVNESATLEPWVFLGMPA
jgi:hypothetical protein